MKKVLLIVVCCLLLFSGCANFNNNNSNNNEINKSTTKSNATKDSDVKVSGIKVIINDKKYILNLEKNKTTSEFIKLLPQEYNMNELNGNEKYVYLDYNLPTNSSIPSKINKGDVMLFGNNCLVIFYESFTTSYSYTKIGHIDDLPDLGKNSVVVKFEN